MLLAGALGALFTIIGIIVNNIFIERQKKSEFERQRAAKNEDNLYEIKKEAYLDFCAVVTSFCSNLQTMADPNQTGKNLTFDMNLSAVGRVYMVASPKLVESAMMLVTEMEHAHRSVTLQLVKATRLKKEIETKYVSFDSQKKEMDERIKYMRSVALVGEGMDDDVKSLEDKISELDAMAEKGRSELEPAFYRIQLTTLETAATHVRNIETLLLSILFYMRNEIGLQFDISSVLQSMKAEHARKTEQLGILINRMHE